MNPHALTLAQATVAGLGLTAALVVGYLAVTIGRHVLARRPLPTCSACGSPRINREAVPGSGYPVLVQYRRCFDCGQVS